MDKHKKSVDKKLGEIVKLMVYAGLKDLQVFSSREQDAALDHYDNVVLDSKDEEKEKLKAVVSIRTEAKSLLRFFLVKIADLKDLEINDDDDILSIIDNNDGVVEDESYISKFLLIGTYPIDLGNTLSTFTDKTNWIQQQIIGLMPAYKNRLHVIATITEGFIKSLKVLSSVCSNQIWFVEHKTVSEKLILGILGSLNLPVQMLEVIQTQKIVNASDDEDDEDGEDGEEAPEKNAPAKKVPAKNAPAKKVPAKKAAVKKVPAKKADKKAPAKKADKKEDKKEDKKAPAKKGKKDKEDKKDKEAYLDEDDANNANDTNDAVESASDNSEEEVEV